MKEKLKKLSKREIILLVVVVLIAGYYFGVQMPISKMSEPVQQELSQAQMELDDANMKLGQLAKMEKELASFKAPGSSVSITPSYDNTNEIIMEMNAILGGANNYTISFGDVEQDGSIIRRPIDLQFGAPSYADALKDINKLEKSRNGYLLTEAAISKSSQNSTVVNSDGSTSIVNGGNCSVSVKMTSFEYMGQ